MINICSSAQESIEVLYFSLKLYLYALSAYVSGMGDETKQIIAEHIKDAQAYLVSWLHRPDIGFGRHFGGKNGNKIKDEIKVCEYTLT